MDYVRHEVYYADSPSLCLKYANDNDRDHLGILTDVIAGNDYPFYFGEYRESAYGCIIPKKEELKEYVPFRDIDEFITEYEKHTQKLKPYGIWLKREINESIYCLELITGMNPEGVNVNRDVELYSWSDALENLVFEDGTPCGKVKE